MTISTLIAIVSLILSTGTAYIVAYRDKKSFTLNYIEMENNDKILQEAREWLRNTDSNFIQSCIDINKFIDFLEYQENNPDSEYFLKHGVFGTTTTKFIDDAYSKYNKITGYLNKILSCRQAASACVLNKVIDSKIYYFVRHEDFIEDYKLLKPYIDKKLEKNPKYKQDYLKIIKKWEAIL